MKWWLYVANLFICINILGMDDKKNHSNDRYTIFNTCRYRYQDAEKYFLEVSEDDLKTDFLSTLNGLSVSHNDCLNLARIIVCMGRAAQRGDTEGYANYFNLLKSLHTVLSHGEVINDGQWNEIFPYDKVRRNTI